MLTKELEGLFGPLNKQLDVLILGEASSLIKPPGVDKPVQRHVWLNSLPAYNVVWLAEQ